MRLFSIVAIGWLVFAGCKKEHVPQSADITVKIETAVQGQPVQLNEVIYPTAVGHQFGVVNLKYYLTRLTLINANGGEVELKKAHLFDIHEATTHELMPINVNGGDYVKMKFTFGIAKEDNFTTFLPNTIENQNMQWPTQLGPGAFHYMKFEGKYDSLQTGVIKNFAFHLGPTMGGDYSFEVEQPVNLSIDGADKTLTITADLYNWFHDPNNYDLNQYTGIMNKPLVQEMAKANGHNVFSVKVE